MPPLWDGDLAYFDESIKVLSFLDLMEVRMVHAFRDRGVSWPKIREAAEEACNRFNANHPFTMKRFRTDGDRIFAEIESRGREGLYDLNRKQHVFKRIVEQTLFQGIEFDNEQAARWFPSWGKGEIVVDPARSFGKPILVELGVSTAVLTQAVLTEKSESAVADWYDVPLSAVRAAVQFEKRLSA